MADFRRWFYALAVVALLAGLTVPVSAQNTAPFTCTSSLTAPPTVRHEGYAELVGDIVLDCTGGTPTPAGRTVPPVNFTVFMSQNVTSKITATVTGPGGTVINFDEALMIIDDPNSANNPAVPIRNCGAAGAPDNGTSGPGVCSIISDGNPADTYNGTPSVAGALTCDGADGDPAAGSYGCGRPNVFQGRAGNNLGFAPLSSVTFAGVPIDPPGTAVHRIIRITNIRVNANGQGGPTGGTLVQPPITAQISANGNQAPGISNQYLTVAYVQPGLIVSGSGGKTFLQCVGQTNASTNTTLTFTEGFQSSWKTRNIAFITNQVGNGVLQPNASYWSWAGTYKSPTDLDQNVPGAIYNTEAGFMYPPPPPYALPSPNPPAGTGEITVSDTGTPLTSTSTGISAAGIATQGTRLVMSISSTAPDGHIPNNTTVQIPTAVLLNNGINNTGAMVLITGNNADGSGGTPVSSPSTSTLVSASANNTIVYEVVFADPFSLESAQVPFYVSYSSSDPTKLAETGITAEVLSAGFAPFYPAASANTASKTLPVPRFCNGADCAAGKVYPLYTINKCVCNLLFPFVAMTAGYDTGIAISNTSLDPGPVNGFNPGAGPQTGTITLWMYGANSSGPISTTGSGQPFNLQCMNASNPGNCPNGPGSGPTTVVPGQTALFDIGAGGGGFTNQWNGYYGYLIAQAQFQYCHAFAFISAFGALANSPGASEGYLALVMDNNGINCNGLPQNVGGVGGSLPGYNTYSPQLGNVGSVPFLGLCRTSQQGETLAH